MRSSPTLRLVWLFLVLFLAACSVVSITPSAPTVSPALTIIPSPDAVAGVTLTPSLLAISPTPTEPPPHTLTPFPTLTATPTVTPFPTPLPPTATPSVTSTHTLTLLPDDLWLGATDLRLHPDGAAFYSGDLISFQVYAHHGHEWTPSDPPDVDLEIWLGAPGKGELIAGDVVRFYGDPDGEARLEWAWDTTGLVGPQTLSVVLDPDDEIQIGDENPDNNVITSTVNLLSRASLPAAWAEARWLQQSSACCVFHYISGSAAERDIQALMALADEAIRYTGEQLGEELDDVKLDVYLINRVLGHGGFAGDTLILSYLDRFYGGGAWEQVLRHEGVHVLDRRFVQVRPTLLGEGLAVYVAGGHFRAEPLAERAAALLAMDRYIPLAELADDFYPSQHEVGYLEAGAFVGFLVDRFGWRAFKVFYSDMGENESGQAAMMDAALQEHFGLTLSQAEADWLATLRALPTPTAQVTDLRVTIDFYETLRRYQRAWDPSAYFLEAWLPAPGEAERRDITADFIRHPVGQVNVTLETMFIAADRAIDEAAYGQAEALLAAINAALDDGGGLSADPLTAAYLALVQATAAAGYQAQQIDLATGSGLARVLAAPGDGADVVELTFARRAGAWHLVGDRSILSKD